MKLIAIYLLSLILFLFTFQNAKAQTEMGGSRRFNTEYFGADHTEASFTLAGQLIVNQAKEPTRENVDPLIRRQMQFMLGLMRSREAFPAALYPKWTLSVTAVKQSSPSVWLVKYNLNSKGLFKNGTTQYTFNIPYNPVTLFRDSQGKCMAKEAEESNFWYHWEPLTPGCPLVENTHYYKYTAQLKTIPNTTQTFPVYDKLVDQNKEIKMTMFFGFSTYNYPDWTPNGADDWGIKGYNSQREFLKKLGYTEKIWTPAQVGQIYQAKDGHVPYVVEMNRAGQLANVRIRLVLLDTGFNANSRAFHTFLRESLAAESVVVYDGHSGIGHNLDLAAIERLRGIKFAMNPNYQILFLGSCVPYSYYTDMFFMRKKTAQDVNGTLNLDILSYGKESTFVNQEDATLTLAITRYAQNGTRTSYQTMIRSSPNYYFGVNGDEDNPTQ